MGIKIGNRDDVERAFRMVFFIPPVVLCPFVIGGMLLNTVPIFAGMVIGGVIGGVIGHFASLIAIKLLHLVWPPRSVQPPEQSLES